MPNVTTVAVCSCISQPAPPDHTTAVGYHTAAVGHPTTAVGDPTTDQFQYFACSFLCLGRHTPGAGGGGGTAGCAGADRQEVVCGGAGHYDGTQCTCQGAATAGTRSQGTPQSAHEGSANLAGAVKTTVGGGGGGSRCWERRVREGVPRARGLTVFQNAILIHWTGRAPRA